MGSSASKTASSTSSSAAVSPPTTKLASDFPSPAVQRAFSFPTPLVHHPPARKGDTHHLVSLTSTSYGSLLLIDLDGSKNSSDQQTLPRISVAGKSTPDPVSRDSFSPDSVINTWELMDGLDDEFEFETPKPDANRNVGLSGSASTKFTPFCYWLKLRHQILLQHKIPSSSTCLLLPLPFEATDCNFLWGLNASSFISAVEITITLESWIFLFVPFQDSLFNPLFAHYNVQMDSKITNGIRLLNQSLFACISCVIMILLVSCSVLSNRIRSFKENPYKIPWKKKI